LVALVTGAGRGIGSAIARRFREQGATVVLNDLVARTPDTIVADVADAVAVRRMFDEVRRRHGRLDVLVNNAGISGLEDQPGVLETLATATARQAAERAAGVRVRTHLDITAN